MIRIPLRVAAIATSVALLAAACSSSAESEGDDITLGLIASASGPAAAEATGFSRGVRLAIEDLNADGGIDGRQVKIKEVDDKGDPQSARSAMSKFAENGVAAVLGPYGSGVTLAAAPVAQQSKIPVLAAGTANQITEQGFSFLFNNMVLGSTYVEGLFRILEEQNESRTDKITKIAVLHEDGPYGTNILAQSKSASKSAGFEVVSELAFTAGEPNLRPLVTRAVEAGAQVLVVGAFKGDVPNVVTAVNTTGHADDVIVASFGGPLETLADDPAAANALWASSWNADMANRPELEAWVEKYRAKYDAEPTTDSAFGWAAVQMLVAAIEKAGADDPAAIQAALASGSTEVDILPPYTYEYGDDGALGNPEEQIIGVQIQDGAFKTVWPETVKASDLELPSALQE